METLGTVIGYRKKYRNSYLIYLPASICKKLRLESDRVIFEIVLLEDRNGEKTIILRPLSK